MNVVETFSACSSYCVFVSHNRFIKQKRNEMNNYFIMEHYTILSLKCNVIFLLAMSVYNVEYFKSNGIWCKTWCIVLPKNADGVLC